MRLVLDENVEASNPCWQFYVQEPDDQPGQAKNGPRRKRKPEPAIERSAADRFAAPPEVDGPPPFDDDLADVF